MKTEAQIQSYSLRKPPGEPASPFSFPHVGKSRLTVLYSEWAKCLFSISHLLEKLQPSLSFFFLNRIRPQIYRLKGGRGKWEAGR